MKALLLTGSPRTPSNSAALGEYLLGKLREKAWETESARIPVSDPSRDPLGKVEGADLVIVSFPLYVDALPSHLVAFLERQAERRFQTPAGRKKVLVGVCQNGFPEASQNLTALAVLKRFAAAAGFVWGGGLAMGMGEAVGRRPVEKNRGMLRRQLRALDLAAEALHAGRPVPPEAVALMAHPLIPRWLYLLMGNRGWKREAKKYGTRDTLRARPFGE